MRTALVTTLVVLSSCTSVQWLDREGSVHLLGWGEATSVTARGGTITQVTTPGLALRLGPGTLGYNVGWRETTWFLGEPIDGQREVLAVGDRSYGVTLDPGLIVVGAQQRIAILQPADERNVVQTIHFEQGRPAASWLIRKEIE